MGAGGKDACAGCITRTPYATLVALIMCWAGVGVFCGTMYRLVLVSIGFLVINYVTGGSTSLLDYCKMYLSWIEGCNGELDAFIGGFIPINPLFTGLSQHSWLLLFLGRVWRLWR
jgi:hypothetical protein